MIEPAAAIVEITRGWAGNYTKGLGECGSSLGSKKRAWTFKSGMPSQARNSRAKDDCSCYCILCGFSGSLGLVWPGKILQGIMAILLSRCEVNTLQKEL